MLSTKVLRMEDILYLKSQSEIILASGGGDKGYRLLKMVVDVVNGANSKYVTHDAENQIKEFDSLQEAVDHYNTI